MVALLTLELRIEHAQSLKDKRQVVRSMKDRLRAHFNVATAELNPSSLWNSATIGVVSVSDSRDYLDGLMKNVEQQCAAHCEQCWSRSDRLVGGVPVMRS